MNIVYTFNDKFVPQVATSICSVCENNRSEHIKFYLIVDSLSHENSHKLKSMIEKYGQKLQIIQIGNIRKQFDFDFDTTGWNPIIVTRLLIDRFLPKNIERILYLDGDTITRGDLASLYATDLGDAVIGAVVEPVASRKNKKALGIDGAYYNSGVLLVDMQKWRDQQIGSQMIQFYHDHDGKLFAPDQDVINGVLKNKIYALSPKYNLCTYFLHYPYRFFKKIMQPLPYVSKDEFDTSISDPVIVHFLGEDRPWRTGNRHKYRDEYFNYIAKTPWKDTPSEDGWQTYFFCYNIFDTLTKPFPSLRYHFLNTFFPLLVKVRAGQNRKAESARGGV